MEKKIKKDKEEKKEVVNTNKQNSKKSKQNPSNVVSYNDSIFSFFDKAYDNSIEPIKIIIEDDRKLLEKVNSGEERKNIHDELLKSSERVSKEGKKRNRNAIFTIMIPSIGACVLESVPVILRILDRLLNKKNK